MHKHWIVDILMRLKQGLGLTALVSLLLQPLSSTADQFSSKNARETLQVKQLVADILQANPQMEVVQATWEASSARAEPQSSWADPQFRYTMAPLTIGKADSSYGQRIELSQQIPWPGKLRLRGEIADHQANAKYENIATVQLTLATTAKALFADWYFIYQAIRINKHNQALFEEFRKIAVTRYSEGLASKQDALRADVERTLLQHQAIVLQREHKTILARLNTLLNRSPETRIPPPQSLTTNKLLPKLNSLRALALQSRPELKVVSATIDASKSEVELAELSYLPDFNLSAGYNSLWDNEDKRFTIGVGINLPLDQSKRKAAEKESVARVKQASWRKTELEARIREELEIAYARVEESLHALKLYREQLSPLAEENLNVAIADYRTGKGDFLTLISSEKNRIQTQLQTEKALADTFKRFAELEYAVGSVEPFATKVESKGVQP